MRSTSPGPDLRSHTRSSPAEVPAARWAPSYEHRRQQSSVFAPASTPKFSGSTFTLDQKSSSAAWKSPARPDLWSLPIFSKFSLLRLSAAAPTPSPSGNSPKSSLKTDDPENRPRAAEPSPIPPRTLARELLTLRDVALLVSPSPEGFTAKTASLATSAFVTSLRA